MINENYVLNIESNKKEENDNKRVDNKYSYLPKYLMSKLSSEPSIEQFNKNSVKEVGSSIDISYINKDNIYKEFFSRHVFDDSNRQIVSPVLNVDSIDTYLQKLSNTKSSSSNSNLNYNLKEAYMMNKNYITNLRNKNNKIKTKTGDSLKINSVIKSMIPRMDDNIEKFEKEIQEKHRIKFEKFEPKEVLEEMEKKIIENKYKIPKRNFDFDKFNSDDNDSLNLVKEFSGKEKDKSIPNKQTFLSINDTELLYNEILGYRDFIQNFHNKFKMKEIPEKNFSQNVFNIENDFYEKIASRIIEGEGDKTGDGKKYSSIPAPASASSSNSSSSENFFKKKNFVPENFRKSTTGTIIIKKDNINELKAVTETQPKHKEKSILKIKDLNFNIRRNFNDKNNIKEINNKQENINNTIKIKRKNIRLINSIQSRIGTSKAKIYITNENELNESFVNSSFLFDNVNELIPVRNSKISMDPEMKNLEELESLKNLQHLQNLNEKINYKEKANVRRESKNNLSDFIGIKNNNLYNELKKKITIN